MTRYELSLRDIRDCYRRDCSLANQQRLFDLLDGVTIVATHDNTINFSKFLEEADYTREFLITWADS